MKFIYKYVPCDMCGGNKYSLYALSPNPDRVLHPQIVECKNCHLIYANPQITTSCLFEFYNNEYPQDMDQIIDFLDSGFEKNTQFIENLGQQLGKMLDIGMGWGHFLHAAQSLGWEVWGTEVSTPFIEYAKTNFRTF